MKHAPLLLIAIIATILVLLWQLFPHLGERYQPKLAEHMKVDACFSCHFDARDVARNPIGHIASHYAQVDMPDAYNEQMLCVDCHTSLADIKHYQSHVDSPKTPLPAIECQDCHGSLTQYPSERVSEHTSREHIQLTKRNGKLYMHSFNGDVLEVVQLKSRLANQDWSTDMARQTKNESHHFDKMQCIDCHADWVPPCIGCHAKQPAPTF
ncbi:hypothetical protein [Vibrio sp. SCSIO 43136]|uniref:hypothetical protein n=1 Tax=Vibrio sp. SCSIO 43136 TaxID=2819101 RepID=UPI002075B55C|nr:hypothetical protein [Vibrio sp. SCSIO 43136]USD67499.1 hypothetical protein J4N39_14950 [Vibrio sp. SCSIO 43136]